jgi:hypothetical protein
MRKRGEYSLAWNTYIRILFSDTPKPAPHARLHPKACAKSLKGFIADAATSISTSSGRKRYGGQPKGTSCRSHVRLASAAWAFVGLLEAGVSKKRNLTKHKAELSSRDTNCIPKPHTRYS